MNSSSFNVLPKATVTATPMISVTRRVLLKMAIATLRYPDLETGEAMVGINVADEDQPPQLIVLETIAPSESTVREWGHVEMGDGWQHAVFEWWHVNWQQYRLLRRQSYGNAKAAKWDTPLLFLGDWHKQPGMIRPSGGDLRTAKQLLRESNLPYLLVPILNFAHELLADIDVNTVVMELNQRVLRVDFWQLRRRSNYFEPVTVAVIEDESVPRLPAIAWYLDNAERYDRELYTLEAASINVMDITPWAGRKHPPLDIGWLLHPFGAEYAIVVLTPATYPHRPPTWRISPLLRPQQGEDVFELCFNASQPLQDVLPNWTPQHHLLDGVRIIKERLG